MTHLGARSLRIVVVLGLVVAASLAGCVTLGPITPVAVTDIKAVAGKWNGIVYRPGSEEDYIELTIREDGSYTVVSRRNVGTSRGSGTIGISDGRLVIKGEKGSGVGTVLRGPDGDRTLRLEATMSDNSPLTASLSPAR